VLQNEVVPEAFADIDHADMWLHATLLRVLALARHAE
jgi:hypothetical protein